MSVRCTAYRDCNVCVAHQWGTEDAVLNGLMKVCAWLRRAANAITNNVDLSYSRQGSSYKLILGKEVSLGNGNPLQYSSWKITWMEKPGRLQSMGSQRVGHD